MGIHGHAKIELTDVNTGVKECYEEDNLVTNAMYHLLNDWDYLQMAKNCYHGSTSFFCNKATSSTSDETLFSLDEFKGCMLDFTYFALKGIKLFNVDITESRNHIYPNSSEYKGVIGYGSQVYSRTSVTSDTKMGEYNASESGALTNGYRFVWDFGTTKANGTIKTVCLTDSFGGATTAPLIVNMSYPQRPFGYLTTSQLYTDAQKAYYRYPVAYADNVLTCIYGTKSDGSSYYDNLCLRTYQFECDSWTPQGGHVRMPKLTSTTNISITSSRYRTICDCPLANSNYYFLLGSSTSASSETSFDYLISVDRKTNAVTETNLASEIAAHTNGQIGGVIRDTYLYFLNHSMDVKKINLTDYSVTTVGTFTRPYWVGSSEYIFHPIMFVEDSVIYTPVGVILDDDTLVSQEAANITSNGCPNGIGASVLRKSGSVIFPVISYNTNTSSTTTTDPGSFNATMQTGWLATINNLATPVIKNNTKTMKITYTITWS